MEITKTAEKYRDELDEIESQKIHLVKCIEAADYLNEFLEERPEYKVHAIYKCNNVVVIKASSSKFKNDLFIRSVSMLDDSVSYHWLEPCDVKIGG